MPPGDHEGVTGVDRERVTNCHGEGVLRDEDALVEVAEEALHEWTIASPGLSGAEADYAA
jgi:hypothetical protein